MSAPITQHDKWLTTDECACLLGISSRTLRRLRAEDRGPAHVQISKRMFQYRRSVVEVWIEQGGIANDRVE